ncbi:MAG: radical SAM protein [Bacteroidota bacterium]|nr:radical SAM protein [Bacteroidota bacterium]
MATFLFDKIVFGPVKSRRLGVSLGINLSPVAGKWCNFDCVYCECGLNAQNPAGSNKIPKREEVSEALEMKLKEMQEEGSVPDVITFAGNGEPTMHPHFASIIDDTIKLRDAYCKSAAISVLSNSTMLHKPAVVEALKKVEQNIMKLDSGIEETILRINQPSGRYAVVDVIENLKQFDGQLILQTMFTRGHVNGLWIDNTTEADLAAWEEAVRKIRPRQVMIYTIDRDTPFEGLKKVPVQELRIIAARIKDLGFKVSVSG